MSKPVLLTPTEHHALRVRAGHGAALGDSVMQVLTFPAEFRDIQGHYPIVFRRGRDAGFVPLALMGLEEGTNLFLDGDRWDATYVPLGIRRQPFRVGVSGEERLIHVDMDHPRIGGGEALFHQHGVATEHLERIKSVLLAVHDGVSATPAFIDALERHALLESFVLDVRLDDGSNNRLAGFHTIDEARLGALDGTSLEALARAGHLLPIYMVLASMSRFRDLIERTNRRRASAT